VRTTLHPVVLIHIARSPKSLVIEARRPQPLLHLLAELMQRAQMVRCRRNLQLRRLEELLIAAIQQPRNLAIQQNAGPRKNLRRPILSWCNLCRTAELPHLEGVRKTLCTILSRCNIKSLTAKDGENIVEASLLGLFRHK